MTTISLNIELTSDNVENVKRAMDLLAGKVQAANSSSNFETNEEAKKEAKVKTETVEAESSDSSISEDDVKDAITKAKKKHGEEFCHEVFDSYGIKKASRLGNRFNNLDKSDYESFIDMLTAGPTVKDDETDDDALDLFEGMDDEDDFGDDEEETILDPEAVETALKGAAKTKGREVAKKIMENNKVKALSALGDASQAQLSGIMKAITAL